MNLGLISNEDGNIADSELGNVKPRIYGRVDGHKLIATDAVLNGYALSGSVTLSSGSLIVAVAVIVQLFASVIVTL